MNEQENAGSRLVDLPPVLILEIFRRLDPLEVSIVCCVCPLFRFLASDGHCWRHFYRQRWGNPPPATPATKEWKELYAARQTRKAFLGKFRLDRLCGQNEPVRALKMLESHNLLVSAGADSSVRLWDLADGLPFASSNPIGDPVRALALDHQVLAAASHTYIRLWHADVNCSHLFNLVKSEKINLRGHTGPVTCLGLEGGGIFSGSWDMSVRLWSKKTMENTMTYGHCDWVYALVSRGTRLLSTAGVDAYAWDVETGNLLRFWARVHEGKATAVEADRTGRFVITGGEDGIVRVFDDRVPCDDAVAAWLPHTNSVSCLGFDDPWLVSASVNGSIALMDLRHVGRKKRGAAAAVPAAYPGKNYSVVEGNFVQRMLSPGGASAYAVAIGADRIVCGGEDFVKIWDFSRAIEAEERVQALRKLRKQQRLQREMNNAGDNDDDNSDL